MQHAAFETVADVGDRAGGISGGGEVDLDVVLRARVPRTILRERMPRAGDHAPAGRGETDHGGMAYAAASPGQEQRAARRIGRLRHEGLSRWSMIRTRRGFPKGSCSNKTLGIHPRLGPFLAGRVTAKFDAVVQAEWAVVPELDTRRRDPPAAPARRTRHLADDVLGGDLGDRLLEGEAALELLRLLARPGADLRLLRAGGEIGVGLGLGHRRHVAADADLTAQRLPVKK